MIPGSLLCHNGVCGIARHRIGQCVVVDVCICVMVFSIACSGSSLYSRNCNLCMPHATHHHHLNGGNLHSPIQHKGARKTRTGRAGQYAREPLLTFENPRNESNDYPALFSPSHSPQISDTIPMSLSLPPDTNNPDPDPESGPSADNDLGTQRTSNVNSTATTSSPYTCYR